MRKYPIKFENHEIGILENYKRSFCIWSVHYRGTPEKRGLVLALDKVKGSKCDGLLFKVKAKYSDSVLSYLRKRELISDAYLEDIVNVKSPNVKIVLPPFLPFFPKRVIFLSSSPTSMLN